MKVPITVIFCSLLLHGVFAQVEDVSFSSGDIVLSATLIRPKVMSPPAIVFVHGSGNSTRSDFKALAKSFQKLGYAALIYDKRGCGESGGDPKSVSNFSFETLAGDAISAVDYLHQRGEFSKIGLYAASQGGWVAPLAASKTEKIRFLVIQSGSVATVGEDNIFERSARLAYEGFSTAEVAEAREMHITDNEFTRNPLAQESFRALWEKYKNTKWFSRVYAGEGMLSQDNPYRLWYRTVVDFDPVPLWRQLSLPVLWLYGEASLDRFCPVEQSMVVINNLKAEGKDYEVRIHPGGDHNLLVGKKQAPIAEEFHAWYQRRGM